MRFIKPDKFEREILEDLATLAKRTISEKDYDSQLDKIFPPRKVGRIINSIFNRRYIIHPIDPESHTTKPEITTIRDLIDYCINNRGSEELDSYRIGRCLYDEN